MRSPGSAMGAGERWSRINLIVGNAEALPLPDKSQDAVISICLFYELPPKVRRIVFRECARVLKPGRRLVLVDSLKRGDEPDYDGAFRTLAAKLSRALL
jgi:ubiquinone/menaquinone biosynthesis C-methylase UbiE